MKLSRPLILLSLAAILPLIMLTATLGAWGLRQQQAALQRDAQARVQLAATLIDRALAEQVSILHTIAEAPVLQAPSPEPGALDAYLARVRAARPTWRALMVTAPDGRAIAISTDTRPPPARAVEEGSHRQAVASGEPAIGPVVRRPAGFLAFAVRVPALRDGKVAYVVSAIVDPREIRDLFASRPLPADWRGGVLDSTGRIVVRINAPQDALGTFATAETLRARAEAATGFERLATLEGAPMISAFQVLPRSGWSVHAAMPLSLYQAPVTRSVWLAGISAVVCLLLAILFITLLMRELRRSDREAAALAEMRRMEALGRMTGGVAHDFNNILMIVQASAEMIKRRINDAARVDALADGVLAAAQRGQALTRQLLAFARRGAQEPVDFRLQDRAEALAELVRRSLRSDIAFDLSLPPETWAIRADPEALEIALINLAVNARDATPDGGRLSMTVSNATLTPRPGELDLSGDFVVIAVKDSGAGIPAQHLRHVFEPFYTTKPVGRGTGLGLSQVYGFARQSGGAVTVQSREGEGALFTLYLPRGAEAARPAPAPQAVTPQAVESDEGRLLLVEDDPDVGFTLESLLATAGYQVARAGSGEVAWERIGAEGFDVVLSDILLGGPLSGFDLAVRLKRERPDLPVVLMSGYAECLDEAPLDHLVLIKPFGPDVLLAALRKARAQARAAA